MSRLFLICLCFCWGEALAQSRGGITNIRDTSFTLHNEYVKLRKAYPQIVPVENKTSKKNS